MTPEQAVTAVRRGYTGIEWSVHFHPPDISRQPTRLHRNDLGFVEPTGAVKHARRSPSGRPADFGAGTRRSVQSAEGARSRVRAGEIAGRQSSASRLAARWRAHRLPTRSTPRCASAKRTFAKHATGREVVVHQHWGTATASASSLYRLLSRYDPRYIGCIYDPGNMCVEGYEDYRVGLGMLRNYVAHVHLKNVRTRTD